MADTSPLTGPQLRNSRPLDPGQRCVGDAGDALVDHVLDLMGARENRARGLRKRDAELRRHTVAVLMGNLANAAMNRVDADRFLAVPFNVNAYSGTNLSHTAMTLARDALVAEGLIEGRVGRRRDDLSATSWTSDGRQGARRHGFNIEQGKFGQLSRWRATADLHDLIASCGLHHRSFRTEGDVIIIRQPERHIGPEPADVQASRDVLAKLNRRLDAADITLPDESWGELRANAGQAARNENGQHVGDTTDKALRRIFKFGWNRGGRLYGGWWQTVPARLRPALLIDGENTVELDYQQLHPTILYARQGRPLADDLYLLPPYPRELGKRAFNHLLNRRPSAGRGLPTRLPPGSLPGLLPKGTTYAAFLELYLDQPSIRPIRDDLYQGEGLRLQREDSDIALDVIGHLDAEDVIALPIHDSFIVSRQHEAALRRAMQRAFASRYGVPARVRVS